MNMRHRSRGLAKGLPSLLALAAAACAPGSGPGTGTGPGGPQAPATTAAPNQGAPPVRHAIIPEPLSVHLLERDTFALGASARIVVEPGSAEALRIGEHLAAMLRPPTGLALPVSAEAGVPEGGIALRLAAERTALGEEGYELEITPRGISLLAHRPAGLFRGVQTLRQLFPPGVEAGHRTRRAAGLAIPAGRIADQPRFAWRGAMLDVARHFFTVDEVKQFVDVLALYKINVLHLHLSDDQGWRIAIDSWPKLTAIGGSTQVGGGSGGFYSKQEYAEIVRYAADRFLTVVPEIDLPGHTNAALAAYPEFSCGKRPAALYTGIEVGFSALCVDRDSTYRFVEDVIREIAALTPGPYLHVGGDEVEALTPEAYAGFVERVQEIVARHGKRMIGWEEVAKARLLPTTLVQQWRTDSIATAALQYGAKLILSPATKVYLDMKYTPATEPGLSWAGHVEVRDAYEWDPARYLRGVSENQIVGVEAPVWTETLPNITAVQYMALPRLPAIAEVGWTAAGKTDWESFRHRLAAHAPRWHLLGVNYYRSPQIPWRE